MAVLINKAMIEIPPKFAGKPPVNPEARKGTGSTDAVWKGAAGMAEDVRYYGKWMRDEAEKRIGHLYPKIEVTAEMAQERPDLKRYSGPQAHRHRLALGANCKEPQPCLCRCGRASSLHLRTLHEEGQGSLHRAGDGGRRLPVHGQGGDSRRRAPRMAPNLAAAAAHFFVSCLACRCRLTTYDPKQRPAVWVHA